MKLKDVPITNDTVMISAEEYRGLIECAAKCEIEMDKAYIKIYNLTAELSELREKNQKLEAVLHG